MYAGDPPGRDIDRSVVLLDNRRSVEARVGWQVTALIDWHGLETTSDNNRSGSMGMVIVNRAALKTDPRVAALVEAFRAQGTA